MTDNDNARKVQINMAELRRAQRRLCEEECRVPRWLDLIEEDARRLQRG